MAELATAPAQRTAGACVTAYAWLKACHVAAVVVFVSGLLLLPMPLVLRRDAKGPVSRQDRRLVLAVLGWNHWVVAPALLLVWALGLALAKNGGFFGAAWLNAKLVLVFGLSALHGLLTGRLRQAAAADRLEPPGLLRLVVPGVALTVVVVVFLVVGKPGI